MGKYRIRRKSLPKQDISIGEYRYRFSLLKGELGCPRNSERGTMTKRFVNPEGSEAFPNDPKDEAAMHELGFFEEGYPKKMYRDGEEPREVISSEEERGLGKGWRGFDEALCKTGGSYRERYIAAVDDPEERANMLDEYRTLHPALARADSWYKEREPKISELQTQAMLKLVSDRQEKDQERSAVGAKATEALVVTGPTPRKIKAGRPRNKEVADRDHLIATLKESCKSLPGFRNKKIAYSLDEQGYKPPVEWGVRTYVEATENPKKNRDFNCMVSKAKFKKVSNQ